MALCPSCGKANAPDARFCSTCATPLVADVPTADRRKTVTVIFCDLAGSTRMGGRLDSEALRQVMAGYYAAMRSAIERHGGTVEKFIGDAVMAVFGIPTLHEDDALRAVRAAADMRAALAELNPRLRSRWGVELQTRTGVNTGEVVAGDPSRGESFVVGDAINVAARLEQAAHAGEILVGEQTHRLVRDAVRVERVEPLVLKGKDEPVPAFRLLEVTPHAAGLARRLDSPLVGREAELVQLADGFEQAAQASVWRLATVLGPAGVGKSRLTEEFTARFAGRATILRGRCLPYGDGITFWPLSEVVRQATGIGETEPAEEARAKIARLFVGDGHGAAVTGPIGSALGLPAVASSPEEIFWATRRLFDRLAADLPLIVVFDDVHWAQPTFLDLLEYLKRHPGDRPVFLLLLARPELREDRPALVGQDGRTVALEPLAPEETRLLIGNLVGDGSIPRGVVERIRGVAQGNPLFVEELVRMLVEDGLLRRTDGHWIVTAEISQVAMPPTIHALLGARLDRLSPGERGVLEPAAVVGQEFWRGAVRELAPDGVGRELDAHLAALVDKELIRRGEGALAGEEAYRFSHILIRDAAYAGMLKEARAELHERFASWLERTAGERVAEYEEILGYHLEQAFGYRQQLAPLDEQGRALGRRAAERLASAGRRALSRGDMPAAANLLERAVALLPQDDAARRELQLDLGLALGELGRVQEAEAVFAEVAVSAAAAGDRRHEVRALLEGSYWRLATVGEGSTEQLRRIGEEAVDVLEGAGDEAGLVRAWSYLAYVDSTACRWAATAASLERGLVHARRAGDARCETELLLTLTGALHYGPTPVEEGLRRLQELLEPGTAGGPGAPLRVLVEATGLAGLEAMQGNFAQARTLSARVLAILEDLGHALRLAVGEQLSGWVELLAGAPAAAEAVLRRSYDTLREIGEQWYLPTTAALLAEAVYAQGRWDEAEALTEVAERSAGEDDVASHSMWRATRAKVLARRGAVDPAEDLAREAVSLASGTDDLNLRADVLMDLAEVLRLAERPSEAAAAASDALELYEAKGNLVSAQRARAAAGAIPSTPPR